MKLKHNLCDDLDENELHRKEDFKRGEVELDLAFLNVFPFAIYTLYDLRPVVGVHVCICLCAYLSDDPSSNSVLCR